MSTEWHYRALIDPPAWAIYLGDKHICEVNEEKHAQELTENAEAVALLRKQRDELLEALKGLAGSLYVTQTEWNRRQKIALEAIRNAEAGR